MSTPMLSRRSPVTDYLEQNPDAADFFHRALARSHDSLDGAEAVERMDHMIAGLYARIRDEVAAETLTTDQARLFIEELAVFARYNAGFLKRAAATTEATVFELAHELRRNSLEEGGDRGNIPAHYTLYTSALLRDLDLMVNAHVPAPATQMIVSLHDVMVETDTPCQILGGYYATEAVAVDETVLLRDITDRYAYSTGRDPVDLAHLDFYYRLHLDEESDGGGVEYGHQEGIASFIRDHDRYGIDLVEVIDGFVRIVAAMASWWLQLVDLTRRSRGS